MKRVIEVPLDDSGAVVLVEADDDDLDYGYDRAALSAEELLETAGGSVQSALERIIRPTTQVVHDQLKRMEPNSIEIEFGLRLTGKAGAVFASTEVEGNLKIKCTWTRSTPPGPQQ